ncbi:unnamed protein product [Moneuplotes crassus]|uniref:Uncharacterized protein n=1 Tax=Euplotes crassus TaxID=5936 RepID=A0AAD1XQ82_EUPCR|nr:unnamed protein product [Moneuplotes crassus]
MNINPFSNRYSDAYDRYNMLSAPAYESGRRSSIKANRCTYAGCAADLGQYGLLGMSYGLSAPLEGYSSAPRARSLARYSRSKTSKALDELNEASSSEGSLTRGGSPNDCEFAENTPKFIANLTLSNVFRKDVLRIVKPLIKKLREEFMGSSTDAYTSSPQSYKFIKENYGHSLPIRSLPKSETNKIEKKLASLETQFEEIRVKDSKQENSLSKLFKIKSQQDDTKKIVKECIEKYHRDNPSDFKKHDVAKKLAQIDTHLKELDGKVKDIPKMKKDLDQSDEIEDITTLLTQSKSEMQKLKQETDKAKASVKTLTASLDKTTKNITKNQTSIDSLTKKIKSYDFSQEQVTLKTVNSLVTKSEQKTTKDFAKKLKEVADIADDFTKEDLDRVNKEIDALEAVVDTLKLKQGEVSKEKIKRMIADQIKAIPTVSPQVQSAIFTIQKDIDAVEDILTKHAKTLKTFSSKEAILKKVDEKILRLKEEQALIDAAQDMSFKNNGKKVDSGVLDIFSGRITKLQQQVEGQDKELQSELATLSQQFNVFTKSVKQDHSGMIEYIQKIESRVGFVSTDLGSKLKELDKTLKTSNLKAKDTDKTHSDKIKKLEDMVTHAQKKVNLIEGQLKKDKNDQKIGTLEQKFAEVQSQIRQERKQATEEVRTFKRKLDDFQTALNAPRKSSIDEDAIEDLQRDVGQMFAKMEAKLKQLSDKVYRRINEIDDDVHRSDDMIRASIQSLKDQNGVEISALFERVVHIKNEIIEDSKKLKDKFTRIEREENAKQEFVIKEIKKLSSRMDGRGSSTDVKSTKVSKKEAKESAATLNLLEFDSMIAQLKAELMSDLNGFKAKINKDEDFQRDRIKGCYEEISSTKVLIDSKIKDYSKKVASQFTEVNDKVEKVKVAVAKNSNSIKATGDTAKKNTAKIKAATDQATEALKKIAKVERVATENDEEINELSERVDKCFDLIQSGSQETAFNSNISNGNQKFSNLGDIFKYSMGNMGKKTEEKEASLDNYKNVCVDGIRDFEQYQKALKTSGKKTPQRSIQKWIRDAENARDVETLQDLRNEIYRETGFDIEDHEGVTGDFIDDLGF